jgi:hypothetical protein
MENVSDEVHSNSTRSNRIVHRQCGAVKPTPRTAQGCSATGPKQRKPCGLNSMATILQQSTACCRAQRKPRQTEMRPPHRHVSAETEPTARSITLGNEVCSRVCARALADYQAMTTATDAHCNRTRSYPLVWRPANQVQVRRRETQRPRAEAAQLGADVPSGTSSAGCCG